MQPPWQQIHCVVVVHRLMLFHISFVGLSLASHSDEPASFTNVAFVWNPQLLTKNPARRLGCVALEGGEDAVVSHAFFAAIDWEKLNLRELEPPFKPRIVSQ